MREVYSQGSGTYLVTTVKLWVRRIPLSSQLGSLNLVGSYGSGDKHYKDNLKDLLLSGVRGFFVVGSRIDHKQHCKD